MSHRAITYRSAIEEAELKRRMEEIAFQSAKEENERAFSSEEDELAWHMQRWNVTKLREYEETYGVRCDMDELARVFELDFSVPENKMRAQICFQRLACSHYGTAIRILFSEKPPLQRRLLVLFAEDLVVSPP